MARLKWQTQLTVRRLNNAVTDASTQEQFKKSVSDFITKRIKGFARKKKPLNAEGSFPPLFESTIKQRKSLKKRKAVQTHPSFSPARSNLTITGQLIEAVTCKSFSARKFEIFVANSKREDSGEPTNAQIAKDVAKLGFVIFDKAGIEKEAKIPGRVRQLLLRFLRKELKS